MDIVKPLLEYILVIKSIFSMHLIFPVPIHACVVNFLIFLFCVKECDSIYMEIINIQFVSRMKLDQSMSDPYPWNIDTISLFTLDHLSLQYWFLRSVYSFIDVNRVLGTRKIQNVTLLDIIFEIRR